MEICFQCTTFLIKMRIKLIININKTFKLSLSESNVRGKLEQNAIKIPTPNMQTHYIPHKQTNKSKTCFH